MISAAAWAVPEHVRASAAHIPTRLPRVTIEQALARLDAGVPTSDVAAELRVHQRVVQRWAKHAGITVAPAPARVPARADAYIKAYRQTGNIVLAAERCGVRASTLHSALRRHAPDLIRPRNGAAPTAPPLERLATAGSPTSRFPVGPLADRLDAAVAAGEELDDIAHRAETKARRLNGIRRHEYPTVTLATADRVCVALGIHLHEVYPA